MSKSDWTTFNSKSFRTFYVVGPSGSTGNDLTCDGVADNVEIQAAINTVDAAGGGTVFLRAGNYNLRTHINLNGKNRVRILGDNLGTVFRILQADYTGNNWGFSFMLQSDGTDGDIIVDGIYFQGGYSAYTSPPSNVGGGVAPGRRWLVQNCVFDDFGHFGFWLGTTCSDTKVIGNRFKGPGSGADKIGGGGADNVEIAYNIWETSCGGNAFDNTGGTRFDIHHNIIKGNNNIYFEAMQHIDAHHNIHEDYGGISALSDAGYNPASITNSLDISISHNRFLGGGSVGYKVDAPAGKSATIGGQVRIIGNYVETPTYSGVLIQADSTDQTRWGNGYIIANNVIHNANSTNTTSYNTGLGICNPSGINVMGAFDVVVVGNTCVDDRVTPQQRYGIQIGQTYSVNATNQPNHVKVIGNHVRGYVSGKTNLVSSAYTNDYFEITDAINAPSGTFSVANGANVDAVTITQNDTTNNKKGLQVTNTGSGTGISVNQSGNGFGLALNNAGSTSVGVLLTGNNMTAFLHNPGANTGLGFSAYTFYRNDVAAVTKGPVMSIIQGGSGDDKHTLELQQSGTGDYLKANNTRIKSDGSIGIGTATTTGALDVNDNRIRVRTAKTPSSATDTGNQGDICWDANFVYICTATNTWKRVAIGSW